MRKVPLFVPNGPVGEHFYINGAVSRWCNSLT
jgi:hypothetical protein